MARDNQGPQGAGRGSDAAVGQDHGGNDRRGRGERRQGGGQREPRSKLYKEEVLVINRCDKVVKGGKRSSFSAFVVLGDSKGKVGYAIGKAKQPPNSIIKAVRLAERNVRSYPTVRGTIPHEVEGRYGASRVRLLPAADGTGVIAGRSVRAVLSLMGVYNVLSKCYGSTNPINVVRATFDALDRLKTKEQYEQLRGVTL